MNHSDYSWCDPEAGNLCPACQREEAAEREDARRLYEGEKQAGMTGDER